MKILGSHQPPGATLGEDGPLSTLAASLSREMLAPVGLLSPGHGEWMARAGSPGCRLPEAGEAARWAQLERIWPGRPAIWRPDGPTAPIWLGFLCPSIEEPSTPDVLAWVGFAPFGVPGDWGGWGPPCPEPALRAWGQSIEARLRSTVEGCAATAGGPSTRRAAGERIPTARLIRRLRVSDPPETFQGLAVAAARGGLGVDAAAWVPASASEPVIAAGSVAGLNSREWRNLAVEAQSQPTPVWIRSPAGKRQCSWRVGVIPDDAKAPAGWVVAVGCADAAPLDDADLEVLRPVASLIAAQRSNSRSYGDQKDLLLGVVRALISAIDAKDQYTSGHSERVARIAVRLGEELDLSAQRRGDLYLAGLLHDIGKIGVDDNVLKKPGPLTPDEYRIIQAHVAIGVNILRDLKTLGHLLPSVAGHHESLDGTGYPSGLRGEQIPFEARILAVADTFDAMSSNRPYRRRLNASEIDAIFRKGAGKQWDPRIVDALFACRADLEAIRQKGLGESLQAAVRDTIGRL